MPHTVKNAGFGPRTQIYFDFTGTYAIISTHGANCAARPAGAATAALSCVNENTDISGGGIAPPFDTVRPFGPAEGIEGAILTKYVICGGKPLYGEIEISGAKNAAVAIIPAALLVDGVCRIENIPQISDVTLILNILQELGADVRTVNRTTVDIDCSHIRNAPIPNKLARKIRASYYLIGALLGRFGSAQVPPPGGCHLGDRPIDQHIKGFVAMGAEVDVRGGFVNAWAKKGKRLNGAQVYLDIVSVGATMNIMLAATLANGLTVIENAAKEPHIVDLANFLNSMGAEIMGAGTDVIKIKGVERLRGGSYSIIPDQIEAGT